MNITATLKSIIISATMLCVCTLLIISCGRISKSTKLIDEQEKNGSQQKQEESVKDDTNNTTLRVVGNVMIPDSITDHNGTMISMSLTKATVSLLNHNLLPFNPVVETIVDQSGTYSLNTSQLSEDDLNLSFIVVKNQTDSSELEDKVINYLGYDKNQVNNNEFKKNINITNHKSTMAALSSTMTERDILNQYDQQNNQSSSKPSTSVSQYFESLFNEINQQISSSDESKTRVPIRTSANVEAISWHDLESSRDVYDSLETNSPSIKEKKDSLTTALLNNAKETITKPFQPTIKTINNKEPSNNDLVSYITNKNETKNSEINTPTNDQTHDSSSGSKTKSDNQNTAAVDTQNDDPPYIKQSLSDILVEEDSSIDPISLKGVFDDIDSSPIITSLVSVSRQDLATINILNDTLIINLKENQLGTANIIIKGTAGDQFVTDSVKLVVSEKDDPPVISNPLKNIEVEEDNDPINIDISNIFTDIDSETPVVTILSNNNNTLLNLNISNNMLGVTFNADQNGTSTIQLEGTSQGKSAIDTFTIKVFPVDDAPRVPFPLGTIEVDEDAVDTVIDLRTVFNDIDDDYFESVLTNNSNTSLMAGVVWLNQLTLDYLDDQYGTGTILLTATAQNKSVTDSATIIVHPVDDAPYVANALSPIVMTEDGPSKNISLKDLFGDIDSLDIVPTVDKNSNESLVAASIVNRELVLNVIPDQFGYSSITIKGTSKDQFGTGYLSVDHNVSVTVVPVDDPPFINKLLTNRRVDEDSNTTMISLENTFGDIDSDNITKQVSVSNQGLVSAMIENQILFINYLPDQNGNTMISVTATADGKSVTDKFEIIVDPVDDAPRIAKDLVINVNEDSVDSIINLTEYLIDIDSQDVTRVIVNNSNSEKVKAVIDQDQLTVGYDPDYFGTSTLDLRANADGKSLDYQVTVQVAPVDDEPTIKHQLQNIQVKEDDPATVIDISDIFQDIDSELINKTVIVNAPDNEMVGTILNDQLRLDYQQDKNSINPIQVSVIGISQDAFSQNSLFVTNSFFVTIDPVDDSPIVTDGTKTKQILEDSDDVNIDLSEFIYDIDSDVSYSVINDNDDLLKTTIDKNILTVDVMSNQFGTAKLAITGTSNEKSVNTTVTINVEAVDDYPNWKKGLGTISVIEDADNTILDLSDYFTDIDNDDELIVLSLYSNSNNETVTASITNNILTLDYQENQSGTATIGVLVTSNNKPILANVAVNVTAVDDETTIKNALSDQSLTKNDEPKIISLEDVFVDIDNDINYVIESNSNDSLVSPQIDGSNLILNLTKDSIGSSTISIKADTPTPIIDSFILTVTQ
ncbi:hypothetical protein DID75_04635 [Candidatus Marinamargulisbacteria bacterium SCGC AG-410-N11]|nr:hypothetical protein DID75_04635 [Candidatus Marinamargulisbacteria bacterium SCGC AG-410-N11]